VSRPVGTDPDWRPPHAYVPGQTPRHPEGLFDPHKTDIASVPYTRLHETQAWALGLAFLSEGFAWEAHEMFEAIWLVCPPNSAEKLFVQALIQQANAALKLRMGRKKAAERLRITADQLLAEAFGRASGEIFGVSRPDNGGGGVAKNRDD